jgi:hypothetical protein
MPVFMVRLFYAREMGAGRAACFRFFNSGREYTNEGTSLGYYCIVIKEGGMQGW